MKNKENEKIKKENTCRTVVNIPIDNMILKEELTLTQLTILKQAFNKVEKIEKFKESV